MEQFESVSEIIHEFQVKETTLAMYGIDFKLWEKYEPVAYCPKIYKEMPVLTSSNGAALKENRRRSIVEHSSSSDFDIIEGNSTGLTQFMSDYDINGVEYVHKGDGMEPRMSSPKEILESESSAVDNDKNDILTSDFFHALSIGSSPRQQFENLNSEPFEDLESDTP
ncbi:uncharacterized protein PRCAT00004957001 [Priceomyces carsonii]|uniref:uncharacterized protein n=1 Tax=Priceomyces carsonii TaxID=28549 RepID=UPI002ED82D34|nr:unnamed protein product [Priceomyces carsonii]